jgi:phosphate starvation-inducible membrane PsiE
MNQQNQLEHYYELEEQILIMFVYQQLLDTITKEMNEKKISYLLTSVNVCSSGLAV